MEYYKVVKDGEKYVSSFTANSNVKFMIKFVQSFTKKSCNIYDKQIVRFYNKS